MKTRLGSAVMLLALAATAYGQIDVCNFVNCGTDGDLDCAALAAIKPECGETCDTPCTVEIDLTLAIDDDSEWDDPATGDGIYDGTKWAVVFKYASVDIPANVTVTFKNHSSYAPVVWLVQGDVTIDGTLNLDGKPGHPFNANIGASVPGPGGFRGAIGRTAAQGSGGNGPGGAGYIRPGSHGTGGSFAEEGVRGIQGGDPGRIYGNARITPLIGGSGGSSPANGPGSGGAGAGGGAILVASNGTITIAGQVRAQGGVGTNTNFGSNGRRTSGGGSGGAIRLIAHAVNITGQLLACGTAAVNIAEGGCGRIRIESNTLDFTGGSNPTVIRAFPDDPPMRWASGSVPTVRAASLMYTNGNGNVVSVDVPADPRPGSFIPDVEIDTDESAMLTIEATNVPTDSSWIVTARLVPATGQDVEVIAEFSTGDDLASTWTADLPLANGLSAIQVRADRQ